MDPKGEEFVLEYIGHLRDSSGTTLNKTVTWTIRPWCRYICGQLVKLYTV